MRVTEKGQVTIPKHIRDKLGIVAGSEVEFVEAADHARLIAHPADREGLREQDYFARIGRARQFFLDADLQGMDGKAYVDWLRGPRDDVGIDR